MTTRPGPDILECNKKNVECEAEANCKGISQEIEQLNQEISDLDVKFEQVHGKHKIGAILLNDKQVFFYIQVYHDIELTREKDSFKITLSIEEIKILSDLITFFMDS